MAGKIGRDKVTLTRLDLEYALKNCKSLASAARFLNVSYDVIVRESKLHRKEGTDKTYYELLYNQLGIGIRKSGGGNPGLVKKPMEEILEGKHPNYNPYHIQNRLLKNDIYLPRRCAICSFFEVRPSDGKIPLRLDFINGDTTDHRLENLRWLCYNHYYIYVGGHGKKLNRDRHLNRFNPKNIKNEDE